MHPHCLTEQTLAPEISTVYVAEKAPHVILLDGMLLFGRWFINPTLDPAQRRRVDKPPPPANPLHD